MVYFCKSHAVFVSPGDVVAIPGGSATFSCFASPVISEVVTSAQWLLNGTLLEDSDIDNVQTMSGTIQLRFSPVSLEYNTTRIRCRGTLTSGSIITSGENMLLIQGIITGHNASYSILVQLFSLILAPKITFSSPKSLT